MNPGEDEIFIPEEVRQQAALWLMRSERGLTPKEQDEALQWVLADRRHGAAMARQHRMWNRLDVLGQWRPEHGPVPNPDLLAPPPQTLFRRVARQRRWTIPLSLAAVLTLGVFMFAFGPAREKTPATEPAFVSIPSIEQQTLEDGSVVELNRRSAIAVKFTSNARTVRLDRGEAHFTVAKNAGRPFWVVAGPVTIHALGTAFNVRISDSAVEVLVTDGKVRVERIENGTTGAAGSELEAGEQVSVPLRSAAPFAEKSRIDPAGQEEALAWKPRLIDFNAAPLAKIAEEFSRNNAPLRVVIDDPKVARTPMNATLRSDNLEGFIRLVEAGFQLKAERMGDTIVLKK